MPKRKSKRYNRPRKIYNKVRIDEEGKLVQRYGLKNRKEIWKADYAIEKIRNIAKRLITANVEEQEEFLKRQRAKGFKIETIADVLSLDKEAFLERRLQSVVVKKKIANTPKQARQLIVHKHVKINGGVIDAPSHLTTLEEEKSIECKLKIPLKKEAKEKKQKNE